MRGVQHMKRKHVIWGSCLLTLVALVISGCATARSVKVVPGKSGVISISPQNSQDARMKAESIMKQTCKGKGYKIVKEADVIIGVFTTIDSQDHVDRYSRRRSYSASSWENVTTEEQTEWQIHYECK